MTEIYEKAVAVRFSSVNKAYYFDANGYDLDLDDYVIVDSIRGRQIGKVVQVMNEYENNGEPLKTVLRPATSKDLVSKEIFNQKKDEALEFARKRLDELNIKGVKILDAEFSYDGTRLQISYASDNDEKVDLKSLKFDLLRNFPTVNSVDLRQLGPRDVAKAIPGMGACGLSCRCCCRYLTEFSSISIKMAKEQGISLTPAEITGMCGRLRCCLVFENDYYVECRKKLPKKNKHVFTPQGEGKVLEVFPLRDAVLVDIPEVGRREFKREQISLEAPTEAKPNNRENNDSGADAEDVDILALVGGEERTACTEGKSERSDKGKRPGKSPRRDRPETDAKSEKPQQRREPRKQNRYPREKNQETNMAPAADSPETDEN